MTINYDEILALIEVNDCAREHYNRARLALEKAVWEAREAHNPQAGEVWHVLLPYSSYVKGVIPAIKTSTVWVTDPAYLGETDIEDGYIPESAAIPLERLTEVPTFNPKEN